VTGTVTAVICAFGPEPHLAEVVTAVIRSTSIRTEVIVVDNGSPACADLKAPVRVLRPGENTGFAGGCNLGARAATGDTLVFINSDALVEPDCLALLAEALHDPDVVLAGATVLVADEPGVVNSWGNPVHLLGFSWAGGYGYPASQARTGSRASVSGAVFGVRRQDFLDLGGLDERYFAYGEDVDLSLRAWLSGGAVEVLAPARAHHHYDFSRNPQKMYLLERNRLITVLTTYRARTLVALSPLLLAAELALFARSGRDGWRPQKVAGWRWLLTHRGYLRRRRNRVQGMRRLDDAVLFEHLDIDLDPPARFGMSVPPLGRAVMKKYWSSIGGRLAGLGQAEGQAAAGEGPVPGG